MDKRTKPHSFLKGHFSLSQDSSSELKRKKQCMKQINGSTLTEDTSSSKCSSIAPLDVSNSVGDGSVADDPWLTGLYVYKYRWSIGDIF